MLFGDILCNLVDQPATAEGLKLQSNKTVIKFNVKTCLKFCVNFYMCKFQVKNISHSFTAVGQHAM